MEEQKIEDNEFEVTKVINEEQKEENKDVEMEDGNKPKST